MGGGRGKSLMQTNGKMAAQEMRAQLMKQYGANAKQISTIGAGVGALKQALTQGNHAARYSAGRARAAGGGFWGGVRKFFGG